MSAGGEMTVYDKIQNPIDAMVTLGKAIAESQMFGCSNVSQGIVLAWECLTSRESSLSLAKKNHIIDGKLSMKADAMLNEFEARGGRYAIVSRTADLAAIELERCGKPTMSFSLSWEQAQDEPFVYAGKEKDIVDAIETWKANKGPQPKLKTKYRTKRARMQMLWARVVSDSIRAVDPGVNYGRYVPEELDDSASESSTATVNVERKSAMEVMREKAAQAGPVVEAEFEVIKDAPGNETSSTAATSTPEDTGYCTFSQAERIRELFVALQIDADTQVQILAKRKVNSARSLTTEQATELIGKLESQLAAASQSSVEPVAGPTAPTMRVTDPATAEQVAAIKTLITEIEQREPGTVSKVAAKLKECGLAKLADLNYQEAKNLEDALRVKNLATFFEASLAGFKPGN